jgi:hypothetical protein
MLVYSQLRCLDSATTVARMGSCPTGRRRSLCIQQRTVRGTRARVGVADSARAPSVSSGSRCRFPKFTAATAQHTAALDRQLPTDCTRSARRADRRSALSSAADRRRHAGRCCTASRTSCDVSARPLVERFTGRCERSPALVLAAAPPGLGRRGPRPARSRPCPWRERIREHRAPRPRCNLRSEASAAPLAARAVPALCEPCCVEPRAGPRPCGVTARDHHHKDFGLLADFDCVVAEDLRKDRGSTPPTARPGGRAVGRRPRLCAAAHAIAESTAATSPCRPTGARHPPHRDSRQAGPPAGWRAGRGSRTRRSLEPTKPGTLAGGPRVEKCAPPARAPRRGVDGPTWDWRGRCGAGAWEARSPRACAAAASA